MPRIACLCPFHHDWDAERVAYRNAVKLEIGLQENHWPSSLIQPMKAY